MSVGKFVLILTGLIISYNIINRIIDIVESQIESKNNSRFKRNKELYKDIDGE